MIKSGSEKSISLTSPLESKTKIACNLLTYTSGHNNSFWLGVFFFAFPKVLTSNPLKLKLLVAKPLF